jgi:hypothetical protein
MKYFYKDPLAAAWMAKHFGMKFVEAYYKPYCNGGLWFDAYTHKDWEGQTLTIPPDSLHLLEQQEGDLIEHDGVEFADITIITRNGTAFMWPESEPA